jgi:D-glycero-alpha-D-manno-heptose-7-phosphate kinase
MLFWTNISRNAAVILNEQNKNTSRNSDSLKEIRQHAIDLRSILAKRFEPIRFGKVLDESWKLKRGLAASISNSQIDSWYETAKAAGAAGGKIAGAGGGGFLCLVVEPSKRDAVSKALAELPQVKLSYEPQGSKILFEQ